MTNPPEKPHGAQPGNQNAAKPADQELTSRIFVNVTQAEKSAMVHEANKKPGRSLSEWARDKLVLAAYGSYVEAERRKKLKP